MTAFTSPRAIAASDSALDFDSGESSLDQWITVKALKNESTGASRTFVSIERSTGRVAGYYCIAASALAHQDAPGAVKRNMPLPIPVILIGRLAVDRDFAGHGLGSSLLKDAVLKSVAASRIVGARALIVDALSDGAENFYRKFGFELMPSSARVLFLLINDAEATISHL